MFRYKLSFKPSDNRFYETITVNGQPCVRGDKPLGSGVNGTVWELFYHRPSPQAQVRATSTGYVVKVIANDLYPKKSTHQVKKYYLDKAKREARFFKYGTEKYAKHFSTCANDAFGQSYVIVGIFMEKVPGFTLQQWLTVNGLNIKKQKQKKHLRPQEKLQIIAQAILAIFVALDKLHSDEQIIHGDPNVGNIKLEESDGVLKARFIDYGHSGYPSVVSLPTTQEDCLSWSWDRRNTDGNNITALPWHDIYTICYGLQYHLCDRGDIETCFPIFKLAMEDSKLTVKQIITELKGLESHAKTEENYRGDLSNFYDTYVTLLGQNNRLRFALWRRAYMATQELREIIKLQKKLKSENTLNHVVMESIFPNIDLRFPHNNIKAQEALTEKLTLYCLLFKILPKISLESREYSEIHKQLLQLPKLPTFDDICILASGDLPLTPNKWFCKLLVAALEMPQTFSLKRVMHNFLRQEEIEGIYEQGIFSQSTSPSKLISAGNASRLRQVLARALEYIAAQKAEEIAAKAFEFRPYIIN